MGNSGGRPSVVNNVVLAKLTEAFKQGFNDEQACDYAQIHPATFYRHMQSDENFAREIRGAKLFVIIAASKVVVNAIKKGNIQAAKWWLDRKANGVDSRPFLLNSFRKEDYEY